MSSAAPHYKEMPPFLKPRGIILALSLIVALCLVNPCSGYIGMRTSQTRGAFELRMTKLSYNGKMVDFPPGSPLNAACTKMGIKPKYSCKKGECASCTISVGGIQMRPCVAKVPPEPKLKSLQEKGLAVKA